MYVSKFRSHSHILLEPSILPLLASTFAGAVLLTINLWINMVPVSHWVFATEAKPIHRQRPLFGFRGYFGIHYFFSGLVVALAIFSQWFSMMRLETHAHTTHVSVAIREGFWWFLISEAFLFVGFFWAYFHNALAPDFKTGRFPNFGIHTLDAWGVPLYNTMILISSGFTLTYGYHTLCLHHHDESLVRQVMAILQRFMFSYYQLWEYFECTFTISQGCWGSVFFMATRFHGMHVLIGTSFLIYNFYRSMEHEFSGKKSTGFEMGTWYWHFVDLIWIALFATIYAMN